MNAPRPALAAFEHARQAMLRAWREAVREIGQDCAEDEAAGTASAMRQIAALEGAEIQVIPRNQSTFLLSERNEDQRRLHRRQPSNRIDAGGIQRG